MADFQLKALITGVDKLSPALTNMQKNIKRFKKDSASAADGAIPAAGGLVAGLTGAAIAYAKTENAATGLKVAMMDSSGNVTGNFQKINDLAISMGNKLPGTTADFQNMMQMLVRQGVPASNILNGVGEATGYLAVQLKKAPEDAAEFAAKMQDATKTASKDMMGLFDTIQKAFYLGVDDDNMLQFFSKAGPALQMVSKDGLAAAKAFAPLNVMLDQAGMNGEAAGNAIRKVFQGGFDKSKMQQANHLLSKYKLNLNFTDGKGEFGGMDNMFAQLEKLKKLTTEQRTTIIKTIFGDDAETLQVLNNLMDKGKSGYDDILKRMNSQASLQKRVEAQLGTLSNLWDAMTGTAVNGLAAIGGAFSGELHGGTQWLGDLAARFSDFATEHPAVIRGAVGLAAGFVTFKLAVLGVNIAMKLLSNTISLSPMGIFLRLIAMAAGLIISNWDTVGPWFKSMWDSTCAYFSAGYDFIKNLFLNWTPLGYVIKNWEPLIEWFKNFWDKIKPYVEPVLSAFNNKIEFDASAPKTQNPDVPPFMFGGQQSTGFAGAPSFMAPQTQLAGTPNFMGQQKGAAGEVTVKFENAPTSMSVTNASSSTGLNVNTDVGYNRFAR